MKAVICTKYGAPDVLKIIQVPKPTPKNNEVLVKIHATTVSAADYRLRSLNFPASFRLPVRLMVGFRKPRKSILGMELSGEIESVGNDVKLFEKGDKIFASTLQGFGAYAEYRCISEDGAIALMPNNISFEEAASVPVGAQTALHYLSIFGRIKSGQKILIYGASGSVGTYAVQLAKYFGADVTGVCSTSNLNLVKSLGADRVFDYTRKSYTSKFEKYDLIFLTVDKCPFATCMNALNKNGTYLNIGRPMKSLEMIWASLTTGKNIIVGKTSQPTKVELNSLKKIIESGQLKPVIDRRYTLDQIVEAHSYAEKGHKKGNVVVTVN